MSDLKLPADSMDKPGKIRVMEYLNRLEKKLAGTVSAASINLRKANKDNVFPDMTFETRFWDSGRNLSKEPA